MQKQFTISATYFLQEGRDNLRKTLRIAFRAALLHKITKVVIFTAQGEGVRIAVDEFLSQPEYQHIRIIAVTFPKGKHFTGKDKRSVLVEISAEDEAKFREHDIPILRHHLPFDPISSPYSERGSLGQGLSLVADALNIFGGSMSLCVQAVTIACDNGDVKLGEHVVSLTSDTAILAQATSTGRMLKELIIREVLCKPAILNVTRRESQQSTLPDRPVRHKALPVEQKALSTEKTD